MGRFREYQVTLCTGQDGKAASHLAEEVPCPPFTLQRSWIWRTLIRISVSTKFDVEVYGKGGEGLKRQLT